MLFFTLSQILNPNPDAMSKMITENASEEFLYSLSNYCALQVRRYPLNLLLAEKSNKYLLVTLGFSVNGFFWNQRIEPFGIIMIS